VQLSASAKQAEVDRQLRILAKKYNTMDIEYLKKKGYKLDANGDYAGLKLLPIDELHFNSQLGTGNPVSKRFLYILLLVACVLVLIACFNYQIEYYCAIIYPHQRNRRFASAQVAQALVWMRLSSKAPVHQWRYDYRLLPLSFCSNWGLTDAVEIDFLAEISYCSLFFTVNAVVAPADRIRISFVYHV
jgi:hypothetical protein